MQYCVNTTQATSKSQRLHRCIYYYKLKYGLQYSKIVQIQHALDTTH